MKIWSLVLMGILVVPQVSLHGQDEEAEDAKQMAKAQAAELRAVVETLTQERDAMRAKLEQLHAHLKMAEQKHAVEQANVAEYMSSLAAVQDKSRKSEQELMLTLRRLKEEEVLRKQMAMEHVVRLNRELEELEAKKRAVTSEERLASVHPEAVQAMELRLVEAQVDNRLSLLESRALVEVLQRMKEQAKDKQLRAVEIAKQKADIYREQRMYEVQMVRAKLEDAASASERKQRELELRAAEAGLQEAAVMAEEVVKQAKEANQEIDVRLSEAAIQLAVSEQMEVALRGELERIKSFQDHGDSLDNLRAHIEALRKELIETQVSAGREEQQLRQEQLRYQVLLETLEKSAAEGER